MKATLYDFAFVHDGFCRALAAWFRRACAMTGARDVTIEHPFCRVHGGAACVFEGRWS